MAAEDGQERTEDPTAKRRLKAREEGQIARSAELSAVAMLLAGAGVLAAAGGAPLADLAIQVVRSSAQSLSAGELTTSGATQMLSGIVSRLMFALAPFAIGVTAATVLVQVAQTRGLISATPLTPKLSHLNPASGLKRILGMDGVVNLIKAVLKTAALGAVTIAVLHGAWPELMSLAEQGAPAIAGVMRVLTFKLAMITGLAFLVVAVADYAYQWFKLEKQLRMSKQEVKHEGRESDGDPHVKARIRSMQRQHARQRMLQAVPSADVIVTNPTHVAVALRYDPSASSAPVVVAMGERKLAERIKAIARAAGVPTIENKPVARALLATSVVGQAISPALYAAVAEILAFVYRRRHANEGAAA